MSFIRGSLRPLLWRAPGRLIAGRMMRLLLDQLLVVRLLVYCAALKLLVVGSRVGYSEGFGEEVGMGLPCRSIGGYELASFRRTACRALANWSISASPIAVERHPTPRGSIRTPSANRPRKILCRRSASACIVSR